MWEAAESPGLLPKVPFKHCPIRTSLGVLGRKWTLLILRDLGFRGIDRFNQLLRAMPGLTPRVLTKRLRELEGEGLIRRVAERHAPKLVRWALTEKGRDTLPILMRLIAFGAKWYPDVVFSDGLPRGLNELFPQKTAKPLITGYV